MPKCKSATLSAGLLAVATGLAAADPLTVRSDVVVRAGPGANFTAIGHVPSGATLELTDCPAEWCQVNVNGIAGFVEAADLGVGAGVRRSAPSTAESPHTSRTRITRRPAPAASSMRSAPPGEDSDLVVDPVQPSPTTRSTRP
jgi:uncharacterized protein YraI